MANFLNKWWQNLCYEPSDYRRHVGGELKVVVIGGGTGLSNLLRGLKRYSNRISAIVAVTDTGASSGIISKEFDILPPGDIRKCISALAFDEELVSKVMEFRFKDCSSPFSGHTLGNIWITALSEYFESFEKAVESTTEIFKTAGKVLPATLEKVDLCARYLDGQKVCGEDKIPKAGKSISKVYLNKNNVKGYSKSIEAIAEAQIIILGPGSLYTSVIPNLLIKDILSAIKSNKNAAKFYICNCSTERGETEGYTVKKHIKAIFDHSKVQLFNFVLVNNKIIKISEDATKLGGVNNITSDNSEILGCNIVRADIVNEKDPLYHDSEKLAKEIVALYNKVKGQRFL